jgi:hypothetical protein
LVHDAARSADDDVDRVSEGTQLPLDRLTTVECQDPDIEIAAETMDRFGHLDREFARRSENERLRTMPVRDQSLKNRQGECCGFACSRVGLDDGIAPTQENGDRFRLDRHRLLETDIAEGSEQGGRKPECGESARVHHCQGRVVHEYSSEIESFIGATAGFDRGATYQLYHPAVVHDASPCFGVPALVQPKARIVRHP